MSRSTRGSSLVLASLAVLWGCSGADGRSAPGDGGLEGGGAKGGATNGSSGGSSAGGKASTGGATGTGGKGAGGTTGAGGGAAGSGTDASTGPVDAAVPDAGVSFDAGTPACPNTGNYVMVSSGAGCGDLNDDAPSQRLDSNGCSGRLEFDSGGTLGLSSGTLTFDVTGVLGASAITVGSSKMTCTGQTTATSILLTCSGDAGTCAVALAHSTN